MPITPYEHRLLFLGARFQKRGDQRAERLGNDLVLHAGGIRREAFSHFVRQLAEDSASFVAVPLSDHIERDMARDPAEEREQIGSRFVRRDKVPRGEIRIVFTFLGGGRIVEDAVRDRAELRSVFAGGVRNGRFIPGQEEFYDP